MAVFMLIATCYGVLQLAVLGWFTRSVRVSTLLLAVAVGLYGCGALAIALQLGYTRALSAVSDTPLSAIVRTASYTVDPFIEEIVKVLPLVLCVLLVRRIRAQWGLTDYLLLGAATGAGFSLVEAMLRFSQRAAGAIPDPQGGWTVPLGFSPQHVPGLAEIFGSWLPAPVDSLDLLGFSSAAGVNLHLAWSALAGLGIGIIVRAGGTKRWLGLVPLVFVAAQHAAYNYSLTEGDGLLVDALVGAQHLLWFYPLVFLAVAIGFDLRDIRRGRAARPEVLLSAERTGRPAIMALGTFATVAAPWTTLVASRFVLVRRCLMYALAQAPADASGLVDAVGRTARQIDAAGNAEAWRRARPARPSPRALLRDWRAWVWLTLAVPSALYLVLGTVPLFADIQTALSSTVIFPLVAGLSILGLAWLAWQWVVTIRAMPAILRQPYAEAATRSSLRLTAGLGALAAGSASIILWLTGDGGRTRVVSNLHILDAVSNALLITSLLLALAALVFFPPFGLVAVAGGGFVIVTTEAAAVSATMLGASAILGSTGILLSEASGDGGGSGESSGSSRPSRLDELSRDPAHGGKITPGSAQEGRIGLELEESGALKGPIERDPTGGAEFKDADGTYWDVKGFNSNFPPAKGGYDLASSLTKIGDAMRTGENVILDTSKLSPQAVQELRGAVEATRGWAGRVLWWP